ncbi:MAG: TetR/AcrR family transcriptional regulator [Gammaproteobacteria bacterium]
MQQTRNKKAAARPAKRLRAPERRRLILDEAQSILASRGFAALTLRNAADASGIRLSTLQYYFPTREQLFEAAFQDIADRAWSEIMLLVQNDESRDPRHRLQRFIKGLCSSTEDEVLIGFFVELWAAARTHEFASKIMQIYYEDALALLARLIRDNQPGMSAKEGKQRATLILSTVEGLSLFRQMDKRKERTGAVSRRSAVECLTKLALQS